MADGKASPSDNAIKEAVFSDILEMPVKMYNPDSHEWQPEAVLSGLEPYKHVTFLSQLDRPTRQSVLDTMFEQQLNVNVCVSPPLPASLDRKSGQLWNLSVMWREKLNMQVQSNSTVSQLRSKLTDLPGVNGLSFGLWFAGKPLSDPDCTLGWLGVRDRSLIKVRPRLRGGAPPVVGLNEKMFSSEFDYDFTEVNDKDEKFMRGGKEYRRPIGWKRYALSVLGKYDDDLWLAENGMAEFGEWAVSYHGTRSIASVQSIADKGYDESKTTRNICRFDDKHKVYSTPFVKVAEIFASRVKCGNSNYCFVFQNRINPYDMKSDGSTANPYWGAGMESMRPYGLLIKTFSDADKSNAVDQP